MEREWSYPLVRIVALFAGADYWPSALPMRRSRCCDLIFHPPQKHHSEVWWISIYQFEVGVVQVFLIKWNIENEKWNKGGGTSRSHVRHFDLLTLHIFGIRNYWWGIDDIFEIANLLVCISLSLIAINFDMLMLPKYFWTIFLCMDQPSFTTLFDYNKPWTCDSKENKLGVVKIPVFFGSVWQQATLQLVDKLSIDFPNKIDIAWCGNWH